MAQQSQSDRRPVWTPVGGVTALRLHRVRSGIGKFPTIANVSSWHLCTVPAASPAHPVIEVDRPSRRGVGGQGNVDPKADNGKERLGD